MPTTNQNKRSEISIKGYVLLLNKIGNGEVTSFESLKGFDQRMATELLNAGLISNNGTRPGHIQIRSSYPLAITPSGIDALESWSAHIKSKSWITIAGNNILRLAWILIGAIIASIPKIFEQ
ncbi:MAG: hypothetical protein KKA76_07310 [Proteobacteria bacterium]|nr:hypothetical protein [Pseudomonadota bacterium]